MSDGLEALRLTVAQWLALAEGQLPAALEARVMTSIDPDLMASQQEFTDLIGAMLRPGDLPDGGLLRVQSDLPEQWGPS